MAKRRRNLRKLRALLRGPTPWYKRHLEKLAIGLLSVGGLSGTGVAMSKSDTVGERQVRVETRVDQLAVDAGETKRHMERHDKALHRQDKKLDRLILIQELQSKKQGVPVPPRELGPEEE